jgi:hypothetical protein
LQGAISKAAILEPGLFRSNIPISNVLNAGEPGARWQAAAVLDFMAGLCGVGKRHWRPSLTLARNRGLR